MPAKDKSYAAALYRNVSDRMLYNASCIDCNSAVDCALTVALTLNTGLQDSSST